jgi:hypothetical protein
MDTDPVRIVARGELTMSDAAWELARSRTSVIGALASQGSIGIAAVRRFGRGSASPTSSVWRSP